MFCFILLVEIGAKVVGLVWDYENYDANSVYSYVISYDQYTGDNEILEILYGPVSKDTYHAIQVENSTSDAILARYRFNRTLVWAISIEDRIARDSTSISPDEEYLFYIIYISSVTGPLIFPQINWSDGSVIRVNNISNYYWNKAYWDSTFGTSSDVIYFSTGSISTSFGAIIKYNITDNSATILEMSTIRYLRTIELLAQSRLYTISRLVGDNYAFAAAWVDFDSNSSIWSKNINRPEDNNTAYIQSALNDDKSIIFHLSYSEQKIIYTKLNATTGDSIGSFYTFDNIWREVFEAIFYNPFLIFSVRNGNPTYYIWVINTTDDNFIYSYEADSNVRLYHATINPNNGLLNIAGSKFSTRKVYYAQAPLSRLSLISEISDANLSYAIATNFNITDIAISVSPVYISSIDNTSLSSPATLEFSIEENNTLGPSFNFDDFNISVVENLSK